MADTPRKQQFEEEGDPGFFFTRKRNRIGTQKRRRSSILPKLRGAKSTPVKSSPSVESSSQCSLVTAQEGSSPKRRKSPRPEASEESTTPEAAEKESSQVDRLLLSPAGPSVSDNSNSYELADFSPADQTSFLDSFAQAARKELGEKHFELVDSIVEQLRLLPKSCADTRVFYLDGQISQLDGQRQQLRNEIEEWNRLLEDAHRLEDNAKQQLERRLQESSTPIQRDTVISQLGDREQSLHQERPDYAACASLLIDRQRRLLHVKAAVEMHCSTLSDIIAVSDDIVASEKKHLASSAVGLNTNLPGKLTSTLQQLSSETPTQVAVRRSTRHRGTAQQTNNESSST